MYVCMYVCMYVYSLPFLSSLPPSLPPFLLSTDVEAERQEPAPPQCHLSHIMVDFLDTLVLCLGLLEAKEAIMTKDDAVEAHSCVA